MGATLTITSTTLAADGRTLTVNVGGIGTGPLLPASGVTGFTVKVGGVATTATISAGTSTVTVFLSAAAVSGATVTVDYAPGNLTDSAGTPNTMAASSANPVTNNSTQSAPNLANIANGDFSTAPGIKSWWRADTIAGSDGTSIGSWTDSSGNGKTLTQTTAGSQPILKTGGNGIGGKNALRFNGGQHLDIASLFDGTYGKSVSVYVVSRLDASQGTNFAFSSNANGFGFARSSSSAVNNTLSAFPPASGSYGNTSTSVYASGITAPNLDDDALLTVQELTYDGATVTVSSNTHVKTNSQTGTLSATGAFSVGARSSGDFTFHGLISEVLICNQAHTTTVRKAIENALITKYSVPLSKQIIHQGDSITGSSNYDGQMLISLPSTFFNYDISLSGRSLAQMLAGISTSEATFYDSRRPRNIVIVWGGTNDLTANSTTTDGTNLYNTLVTYCRQVRALGFRVIVATMLPRYTGTFETQARPQFNSLVRANWQTFADGLIDIGNDSTVGQAGENPSSGSNTYYGDGTHLNSTGGAIVAGYAAQAVNGGTAYAQNATQPGVDNGLFAGQLTAGSPAQTGVPLAWLAATGGVGPYTYQLQRAPDVSGTPGVFANIGTAGTSLTYPDSGLTAATTYWYQVQVTDSTSVTPIINYSNMAAVTTASSVATLVAPTPSVTSSTTTSLAVSWGAATGGTAPYTYALQRSTSSSGPFTNVPGATASPFTDSSRSPGTTYYYQVVVTDSASGTATSSQGSGTTSAALAAGTVTVGARTSTSISLYSTTPSGGTGPYSYQWYRNTGHVSFLPAQIVTGTTSATLNDTGLTPNTTFYYVCQYTDSASSSISSLETQTSTQAAPAQVGGLALGNLSVPLSWTAVSGAVSYKVYRNGALIASPTNNSVTDTIAQSTSASYTVSAVDAGGGEGQQSSAVVAGGLAPYTQISAIQGEIGFYGNPSYQPDINATYTLLRDGQSIERVGGGVEVGKVTYVVPGGTRIDRYDTTNKLITSVFVPTP